ncbi:MAG: hypothetical protein ACXWML_03690 [Candidatus Binataceae bacterium]
MLVESLWKENPHPLAIADAFAAVTATATGRVSAVFIYAGTSIAFAATAAAIAVVCAAILAIGFVQDFAAASASFAADLAAPGARGSSRSPYRPFLRAR